jgi:hypothetical protein
VAEEEEQEEAADFEEQEAEDEPLGDLLSSMDVQADSQFE